MEEQTTKKNRLESTKKVVKNSGEVSGMAIGIILSKVLDMYGIPLNADEAVILGGFFASIGSSIRHLFGDK